MLVLIPTRLGLNKIDKDYYLPILKFFECELNMGIIGGQPKKALYFVGCQKQDLIFLDPHIVKDAIDPKNIRQNHMEMHCDSARKLNITKIDTSLTFAFYIKDP